MTEKVIEVRNLTKKYDGLTAVDRVSFDVLKGEVFSLVGPNGAGKTTTVEILECLRKPTEGSAKVFGYDVLDEEEKIKKRIGVVPQEFNTFDRLTVEENVSLIAKIYGKKENVERSLEILGLVDDKTKQFGDLSGGMKRRVGIAMALAGDPELLFLDEPTTGLDPQARRELWGTIKGLKKTGVTVFLTTHYMEEVEELSDRASIILEGKVLSTDTIDKLISKFGGKIKIVVKDGEDTRELLEDFAEEVFLDESENLIGIFDSRKKAAEANLSLYTKFSEDLKVDMVEPSMEDVFLHVAGGRLDESGELVE